MDQLSEDLLTNLFTTESLNVELAIFLRSDTLSRIVAHTPAGLQLLERHLDSKRMQEVVRLLDQLVFYFKSS